MKLTEKQEAISVKIYIQLGNFLQNSILGVLNTDKRSQSKISNNAFPPFTYRVRGNKKCNSVMQATLVT